MLSGLSGLSGGGETLRGGSSGLLVTQNTAAVDQIPRAMPCARMQLRGCL